jgi:hypothetical protein
LLNAATAVSLALCPATLRVWASNVIVMCRWDVGSPEFKRNVSLGSFGGRLALGMGRSPAEIPSGVGWYPAGWHPLSLSTARFDVLGFALWRDPPLGWALAVPGWLVPLLFALLPGSRLLRTYRLRRAERRGRCPDCGYDLRATPARCPECGRVFPP